MNKRIIKKAMQTEHYQRDKLHASIKASCLSSLDLIGASELNAQLVCNHVEKWLDNKEEVTSADIRRVAGAGLFKYNPSAAYVYVNIDDVV